MKGKCKICGREFEKKSNHNMYCSDRCKEVAVETSAKKHIGEEWQGMKIQDMFVKNGKFYAVLFCRVCGRKFSCRYDSLQRGQKSCGCDQSKPSSRADIIGKKFGRLTPIKAVGSKKGAILYLCKCDCGNDFYATSKDLNYGSVRSCGCKNIERLKSITPVDRETWGWVDGTLIKSFENGTIYKTNTSGVRGVSWNTSNNGWIVRITYKGKVYHLGTFKNHEFDIAKAVRKAAETAVLENRFFDWLEEYRNGKEK